jgi:hypothetical protein
VRGSLLYSGLKFLPVAALSVRGGHTPSIHCSRVWHIQLLPSAPFLIIAISSVSPQNPVHVYSCSGFHRRYPDWPHTPRRLDCAVMILTLQGTSDIYQCQLYASILGGVGGGGSTTINQTPSDLALDAAAASACPTVEWVPAQLCPLQSHYSLGSLGIQESGPRYQVQCCPNTRSLICRPLPSLTASIKYRFQGEETVSFSEQYIFKGSSSTVPTRIALTLLNVFKGWV